MQENRMWILSVIIVNSQWRRPLWIYHIATHTCKIRENVNATLLLFSCVRSNDSHYCLFSLSLYWISWSVWFCHSTSALIYYGSFCSEILYTIFAWCYCFQQQKKKKEMDILHFFSLFFPHLKGYSKRIVHIVYEIRTL